MGSRNSIERCMWFDQQVQSKRYPNATTLAMHNIATSFEAIEEHFRLEPSFFDRESHLHGITHTYRVMTYCLVLGSVTGHERESLIAFCGAFIHDMARSHDGRCEDHGLWAAERKHPLHRERFLRVGIREDELSIIADIVTGHSQPGDVQIEKMNIPLAILKDADALDRVRLGENNLKPEFLRFAQSHALIEHARRFYAKTANGSYDSMEYFLRHIYNFLA